MERSGLNSFYPMKALLLSSCVFTALFAAGLAQADVVTAWNNAALDAIREANLIERTTVRSFDHRSVLAAKQLEPRLKAAILVEGFGLPHARVPARPAGELAAPAPQLHLPTIVGLDGIYAYWGIGSFPRMANAASSFDPRLVADIRKSSKTFPNADSVRFLRFIGVRSVVFHRDLARGTAWQAVPSRPIAGLGITRRNDGDLVIYDLGS